MSKQYNVKRILADSPKNATEHDNYKKMFIKVKKYSSDLKGEIHTESLEDLMDHKEMGVLVQRKVREYVKRRVSYYKRLYESIDEAAHIAMTSSFADQDLDNVVMDIALKMKDRGDRIEHRLRYWCRKYYLIRGWKLPKESGKFEQKDYDIDLLKTKVTAEDLLSKYGIEVKRKRCRCIAPDHNDQNPSMHVYEYNVHCFSCKKTYDTIGIIQRFESVSFPQALAILDDV